MGYNKVSTETPSAYTKTGSLPTLSSSPSITCSSNSTTIHPEEKSTPRNSPFYHSRFQPSILITTSTIFFLTSQSPLKITKITCGAPTAHTSYKTTILPSKYTVYDQNLIQINYSTDFIIGNPNSTPTSDLIGDTLVLSTVFQPSLLPSHITSPVTIFEPIFILR